MMSRQSTDLDSIEDAQDASGFKGGFARRSVNRLRQQQGGESAEFGQRHLAAMAGFANEEQDAQFNYDDQLWQAQQQATQDAINNQQFNPAEFTHQPGQMPTPQQRQLLNQGMQQYQAPASRGNMLRRAVRGVRKGVIRHRPAPMRVR